MTVISARSRDREDAGQVTERRPCAGQEHTPGREHPPLRDGELLCRRCVGRTMHFLEELTVDLLELDVTLVRQSAVRHGGSPGRRRHHGEPEPTTAEPVPALARELPLPFNEAASLVRRDVEQRLVEWAVYLAGVLGIDLGRVRPESVLLDPGLDPRRPLDEAESRCVHDMLAGTCASCRGLPDPDFVEEVFVSATRPPHAVPPHRPPRVAVALAVLRSREAWQWMRVDEQGGALADAVAFVRARVRSSIDRFDRRWYAGECGRPVTVVDLVEDDDEPGVLQAITREDLCRSDLYAEPGASVITCDGYREPGGIGGCGALHPAVSRRKQVLALMLEKRLPLDVILSLLPPMYGRPIPDAATVRTWRHRGQLRPVLCLTKHPTGDERALCRGCRGELYAPAAVIAHVINPRRLPIVCLAKHGTAKQRRGCEVCERRRRAEARKRAETS